MFAPLVCVPAAMFLGKRGLGQEEKCWNATDARPAEIAAPADAAWSEPTERAMMPPVVTSPVTMEPPARAPVMPPQPAPVAPAPPPVQGAVAPPAPVAADPPELIDSTAVAAAMEAGITLPFKAVEVAEAPAPIADRLPPQTANIDETAALGVELNLGDVLPFEQDAAPVDFTIEQYASLCAERDLVGATHVTRVLERYGVPDQEALRALDGVWTARLQDPAKRARFDQLRARYRQWLEEPGRG